STVTIPPFSEVAFPPWTELQYAARGNNTLTIVGGTGVTVNPPPDGNTTLLIGDVAYLKKVDTDEWDLWSTRGASDATESTGSTSSTRGAAYPGNLRTEWPVSSWRNRCGYRAHGLSSSEESAYGFAASPIDGYTVWMFS